MPRLLVAGDEAWRSTLVQRFQAIGVAAVDDADPAVGDVVMFLREERERYDAVVFVGHNDPVTRGALAVTADRAVLIPLVAAADEIDPRFDGYLYRLPRALGFRAEEERRVVHGAVEKSKATPSEILGPGLDDEAALRRLVAGVARQ